MSGNVKEILEAAKRAQAQPEQIDHAAEPSGQPKQSTSLSVDQSTKKTKKVIPAPKVDQSRSATGKRSNPEFEKVGVYVRRDTRRRAIRKYEDEGGSELSDLIETLLSQYVNR